MRFLLGLFFLSAGLDVELPELLEVDFCRAGGHEVNATVVFREGNDFADAILAGYEHDQPVKAECHATMRRGTKAEGVKQVAEFLSRLVLVNAKGGKHLGLQFTFVDSYRPTTDFVTIEYNVIGLGTDVAKLVTLFKQVDVFFFRAGKWVVYGVPFAGFLIQGKQRKVRYP